jgi:hypothetical protein
MSQGVSSTAYGLSNTILTIIKSQNLKVLTGDIDCPQLPTANQPGRAVVRLGLSASQEFEGSIISDANGTYFSMTYSPNSESGGDIELLPDMVSVYLDEEVAPFAEEDENVIVIEI